MKLKGADPVRLNGVMRVLHKKIVALLPLLLLSGCISLIPKGVPQPPAPLTGSNAALVGTHRGPLAAGLGFQGSNARAALTAFVTSCPRLTRRTDASGKAVHDDRVVRDGACRGASRVCDGEGERHG